MWPDPQSGVASTVALMGVPVYVWLTTRTRAPYKSGFARWIWFSLSETLSDFRDAANQTVMHTRLELDALERVRPTK